MKYVQKKQQQQPGSVTWWNKTEPALEQRSITASKGFLMMFVKTIMMQKPKELREQYGVLSTISGC